MNVSHQTTEQLQANLSRTRHAESYGKSIAGQRLIQALEAELDRRHDNEQACSGDCGDCMGCQPIGGTAL